MLRAKSQIGAKSMRMNFSASEKALPNTPEYEEKRKLKREVKRASKADILGTRKTDWNQSVHVTPSCTERTSCQVPKHDPTLFQYNYRAETLPRPNMRFVATPGLHNFDHTRLHPGYKPEDSQIPPAARCAEIPVHASLESKASWQPSTEIDRRALDKASRVNDARCVRNSRRKNAVIVREGYVGPVERESMRMERLREEREAKRNGTWQEPPAPSPNANNAAEDATSEPPRRSKSRKYKEYYNDGVYEYSQIAGGYVWSCSMNPNPEFRGSCYKIRNPDAWNFASP
ncbi:Hypothetical Protein FCC1311_041922 [Hondaea fermentalgiana]|uniref:Uncharacterized protein n=1 Tax=Hondaea fermentalgiana TaxID=2315210 RepID=A0A2R5GCB0_9STRA|nr:Hypothetical Protein FCC1311_041922 [Hondaea fermentalgiana]|eukprot:GBG27969.1 Hypothetical Protein FCC1311_041922 [Hondaea fermentalgiana]